MQYTHPLPWDAWTAKGRLDYRFQTEYFVTVENDPIFENGDTFTLDLSLQLQNEDLGFGLQLWGKNVTNEEIILFGSEVILASQSAAVQVNDPATWGVTGFYRF